MTGKHFSSIVTDMQFRIQGTTPSQNKMHTTHWRGLYKIRTEWHDKVAAKLGKTECNGKAARVHVVRASKRLIDPLNVYSGLKWLIDALVVLGWLRDDAYKDIQISADQRKVKKGEEPYMEVTIEYLTEENLTPN